MHPSSSSHGRRHPAGFTFVELLMALTVAAAIMAMAIPRMAPMRESASVRSSKQVVMAYVATARQAAIRRGTDASFHASGNTVWVTARVDGVDVAIEPRVDLLDRHGVALETGLTQLTYNPRGFASPRLADAELGVLRLKRGVRADSLCVTVLGMLGRCGL